MAQERTVFTPAAVPWRDLGDRFASVILSFAAIALLVMGRIDPVMMDRARTETANAVAPILAVVQQPVVKMRELAEVAQSNLDLAKENARLREENANLMQWQATALKLEAQSSVLRNLLKLPAGTPPILRTEPVIAEPGGAYVRSVLVGGGAHDGLGKGQAAMSGAGLVGRITEIGAWSARVLLITDLNSRIPVILETTRAHAILAGDNSSQPYLMYLPKAATVNVGDRLVTAGHDGVFPTGLAVGRVSSVSGGEIRVEPLADLDRLEYVELVDNVAQSTLTPEIAPAEAHGFFENP